MSACKAVDMTGLLLRCACGVTFELTAEELREYRGPRAREDLLLDRFNNHRKKKEEKTMKKLTAVVLLLAAVCAPARAQIAAPFYRGDAHIYAPKGILLAQATTPAPPSMASAAVAEAQALAALPGPWNGKLDLAFDPAPAAWQSVTTPEQVIGVSKLVWYLSKGNQPLLNVGVSAGLELNDTGGPAGKFIVGPVVQVPGSTLDWALGTNMGAQWVPSLKTGLLIGYDLAHPHELHAAPGFVGAGVSYPVFGSAANTK